MVERSTGQHSSRSFQSLSRQHPGASAAGGPGIGATAALDSFALSASDSKPALGSSKPAVPGITPLTVAMYALNVGTRDGLSPFQTSEYLAVLGMIPSWGTFPLWPLRR